MDEFWFYAWIVSGYIGALLLIFKGYFRELRGCAVAAGGWLILLPAVAGSLFLPAGLFCHLRATNNNLP